MIKKSLLKSSFERLVSLKRQMSFGGFVRAVSYEIKIFGTAKSSYIALVCCPLGAARFVIARSYPMLYKSAYRLVCSL